jgi:hypothetical protein
MRPGFPGSGSTITDSAGKNNVPALLAMDIDGVRQTLGPPHDPQAPTADLLEGTNGYWFETWDNGDSSIMVFYRYSTGKLDGVHVGPSKGATTKEHLLELAHITAGDPRYKVDFIESKVEPGTYAAVQVNTIE